MLIAIEGIDGAGKTTLAKKLKKWFENRGMKATIVKEPGESEWGKMVRERNFSAEEELELFLKDREINVKEKILPEISKGNVVIMDRYYYSNIAYQGAKGLSIEEIKVKNERIAPKPDIVLLLDCSPEKCVERVKKRGKTSRFEKLDYLKKVRELFLKIASTDKRVRIINAEKSEEEVFKSAIKIIEEFLSKRGNSLS